MKSKISPYVNPGLKTPDEYVAEIWEIPVERLKVKTHKREVTEARMVLMSYRNRNLKMTLKHSASKYGLSHNATIHACKTVDIFLETDKNFKIKYEEFIMKVNR